MSLVIANNVPALGAQHNLTRTSNALSKSLERLSSGFKVNRGADGPAALVTSEKQRAQIAGLSTAIDNTNKAVSMVQTAEGALTEINSLLVKVRSLALDSANAGVNDADAQAANQAEIANALDTIDRIANNTQFGSKKLLDGSAGVSATATGADVTVLKATDNSVAGTYAVDIATAAERATVSAGTDQTAALAANEVLTINGVSVTLNTGMSQAEVVARVNEFTGQTGVVAVVDGTATKFYTENFGTAAEISVVSNLAAEPDSTGVGISALTDTGVNIEGTIGGNAAMGTGNVLTGTAGNTMDVKISLAAQTGAANAHLSVTGAQGQVTVTDNSLVFQIGANRNQTVTLGVSNMGSSSLGVGLVNNQFGSLSAIDVTSASKAQDAIAVIDQAIDDVSTTRGALGAFQGNTLESTANNLRATLENTVAAESVIRDTDFAVEIANMTQQQILQQAGLAVLGNANQMPQMVLSLLR
ncbi:MAG: flagellin [Planctomycetaceae bacterium]|nr:MAG: flagellin [Planctomycetaceae bacterium]